MTVPVHVLASDVDQQKAAPLGLFVLILLGVACYFLFKSMSGHLRRVRDEFPAAGFAPTDGRSAADDAAPNKPTEAVVITTTDGLTRPAPVTLTRGRAAEPQLVDPHPGARMIEPRVIEPQVIEPQIIEPRVIEPQVIEPDEPSPT